MKYRNKLYRLLLIICIPIIMLGCRNDDLGQDFIEEVNPSINFTGLVGNEENVSSRANNTVYNITYKYFPCNFYIALMKEKTNNINNLRPDSLRTSLYYLPSGATGSLISSPDHATLNWINRKDNHYFNAWTAPWRNDYIFGRGKTDNAIYDVKDTIGVPFMDTKISDLTSVPTNNQNAEYYPWKTDSWKNGKILEQFVGCRMGPFTYISNGSFVPLQLRHLVSKIYVNSFVVIDNVNGTTNSSLRGEITFFGLPNIVPFYPLTRDDEGNFIPPRLAKPEEYDWDYDQSKGVTYAVTNFGCYYYTEGVSNGTFQHDCWYFPPEIDLTKLSFKITIYEYISGEGWRISTSHGNHGSYYGDLSKISISRTTNGTNYDETNDQYVLHGGETFVLSFNLYERGEPSLRGIISSWNDFQGRDASQHVESGIYSIDELTEFSSVMSSSADKDLRQEYYETHNGGTTASDPADLYPEYPEEKKVIKIYDDIGSSAAHTSSSSSPNKMTSNLYVDDEYILDGQGHTVNLAYSYINLGPVRDIYFRHYSYSTSTNPYTYTEYIVYIDKMGNVYTVDPETFEETPTGVNVNEAGKNPYRLDLATGTIS